MILSMKVYIAATNHSDYFLCKDGKFRQTVTSNTVVYRTKGHAKNRIRKIISKYKSETGRNLIRPSIKVY